MDECTSRKGSGLFFRDTATSRDRTANSLKATQNGSTEKAKSSRLAFRSSSSGKEIIGTSSRAHPTVYNPKNSFTVRQKKLLYLRRETYSSDSSSVQEEPEVLELGPPPGEIQRGGHHNSEEAESSKVLSAEAESSNIASSVRSHRNLHRNFGLSTEDSIKGFSEYLASKSTVQAACAKASRYGLRNLRCNSGSDVTPSGYLSSDSSFSKRKNLVEKRNCEGECSFSTSGQKMIGPSSEERHVSFSHSISISDSRRTKISTQSWDNNIASVRTQRSTNGYNRGRLSNKGTRNSLSPNDSPVVIQQVSQPERPNDGNYTSPLHQFSAEASSSQRNSYSLSGRNENFRSIMTAAHTDVGSQSLLNRDSFRHYNVDGIAEVFMAFERIGQDLELANQQLAVLEANLSLSGLNFFDQHREMRLDIDNMSYEELLALEERMGSVSTALTEKELSQCLNISIYESKLPSAALSCEQKDKVKCSICQEEYIIGDEVGSLHCEHKYHVDCIQNWMRLKNWCPICKSPAAPSASPSPSKSDQQQET